MDRAAFLDGFRLGYYNQPPLTSTLIPFGTEAINYSTVPGGTHALSIDAATRLNGRPSSKITITGAGTSTYIEAGTSGATITLDNAGQGLASGIPLVFLKVDSPNVVTTPTLYIGDATWANYHIWSMSKIGEYDGWAIYARRALTPGSTIGTPDLSVPVRAKIRVSLASTAAVGNAWFSLACALPPASPSVVLTLDDGLDEWEWVADEAHARGVPVSFGVTANLLGNTGYLTPAQVQSIAHDYDGLHIITNHAKTHVNYTTLGLSAYMAELEYCRDYLVGLGIHEGHASLHQYVQGVYDATLITAMKAAGFLSARAVQPVSGCPSFNIAAGLGGAGSDSLFHIPGASNFSSTQNLAAVQANVTASAALGTAFMVGHKFEPTAGAYTWVNGYDDNYGILNLLDWAAEKRDVDGWRLLNWYGWYSDRVL